MGLNNYFNSLKGIMTTQEAAEKWGKAPRWIREMCEKELIVSEKVGGIWLIQRDQEYPNVQDVQDIHNQK